MDESHKICMTCERLGKCDDTSIEMLKNKRGCGSWFAAHPQEVEARSDALAIAGFRALEAMILKSPPKKPAKDYRR
ncbi:MAG TPA: hypothetical protein VLA34_01455 [Candidatus Krumholzibacterium sp.]|nr:hypothetical protein [Candidatus Krumholzibacterium sp.]